VNYRHHFHAGNYADVFKHVLLLQLLRAMRRKDKPFLFLDTHAGRGSYDLTEAHLLPGGKSREPEWPGGVGRVWEMKTGPLAEYAELARRFSQERGGAADAPHYLPGSPMLAALAMRPQDRLALCELRPEDAEALEFALGRDKRAKAHVMDGYTALKAMLPPPEKRALVLVDPPYESQAEFAGIERGLQEALRRFPTGVYAVWYPLTERSRAGQFLEAAASFDVPALVAEIHVAGDSAALRMKGCGLLVLNPPWQFAGEVEAALPALKGALAVDAGAAARTWWLVPEK
jgi:23S rRNA (adenine2030-N6)-methyltransferase